MVKLGLSEKERTLIEEIEEIKFGEILNIPKMEVRPTKSAELHPSFVRLLKLLRHHDVDRITIHNSKPTFAETSGVFASNHPYKIKHKLG